MVVTLSEDQLRQVNSGEPVSVRSPEFAAPVVLCRQEEFAGIVLSIVQGLREKLDGQLSEEELKEEIEEAIFRKAWMRAGRRALARGMRDDSADAP